jgi:cobalamin biosynthesis protein CobW
MTEKIPVTIVTGFLGAGKTSLISRLVERAAGRRLALVVNEFGEAGFDGAVLSDCGAAECRPAEVIELTNGCICCTVADDFLPAMEALLARDPAPDAIVIETSGLALPQPLLKAFAWPSVRHRVTVDGVVTLVDSPAMAEGRFAPEAETLAGLRAAAEGLDHDNPIEEVFADQLRCADLVVLSKTDLLAAPEVDGLSLDLAGRLRPGTRVVRAGRDGLPPELLLGLVAGAEDDVGNRPSHHDLLGEEHEHDDFDSFVLPAGTVASIEELKRKVAAVMAQPGVLRVKGRAALADRPVPAVVQAVGPRVDAYFAPLAGPAGLVVIGERGMDRAAIEAALAG